MRQFLVFLSIPVLLAATCGPVKAAAVPGEFSDGGSVLRVPALKVHLAADTQYKLLDDGTMELVSGDALVEVRKPAVVVTPLARTLVKSGSVVLFSVKVGIEREMVMWDYGRDSVVTISHKSAARLGPGDEVVVSDHKPFYREINQSDMIGRRRVRRFFVGNGLYMTTTEFSVPHAVRCTGLIYSPMRPDQDLTRRLLKVACILERFDRGREPYMTGVPLDTSRFDPRDPLAANEDRLPPVEPHGAAARQAVHDTN